MFDDSLTMPPLRPLPIATKGKTWWQRFRIYWSEPRRWVFIEGWFFRLPDGTLVEIPEGFIFDGASVPRIFWWVFPPTGILLIPAVVHDHGYEFGYLWQFSELSENPDVERYGTTFSRADWDRLFLNVGREVNGTSILMSLAYRAVRLGGGRGWRRARRIHPIPKPAST